MQNWVTRCTTAIRYLLYTVFFAVPLVFTNNTSELFEFNKMWLTFGICFLIFGFWATKMTLEKKFSIQRTPLDIPLLLFLGSQIISTIFSMDQHVSWWGYYSRFNGGLLSTIAYIFLYYAVVTNLRKKDVIHLLWIAVSSCILVALWGLPSHFGHDPTCLLFRGTFDVSCWTDAFKPTVRIFSTLGQPDWLAAYLSILIPLTISLFLYRILHGKKTAQLSHHVGSVLACTVLVILFYADLIFTNTRAGFIGFWIGILLFWAGLFFTNVLSKKLFWQAAIGSTLIFLILNFFYQTPINQLNTFTLPSITSKLTAAQSMHHTVRPTPSPTPAATNTTQLSDGITDSATIRLLVWQGAIKAWEAHPLIGTGVETFAFAYYQYRPVAHNMTSEWDYLYNKAHNEYLNYLATTGILGLGTYLFFIGGYCWLSFWFIFNHRKDEHARGAVLLSLGLLSAFVSILISNFFGFSVVIINEFLFLIPAFFFILTDRVSQPQSLQKSSLASVSMLAGLLIATIWIIAVYYELIFITYWNADVSYALGHNYDSVNQYQQAYQPLVDATNMRPDEPVFLDELSVNEAALAVLYAQNKDMTNAQTFASQAINASNQLTTQYPSNVLFWKSRVRIYVLLASYNQSLLINALQAIQQAHALAPTDAKILYNLGVLYGRTGNVTKGVQVLQQTIQAKPDYRDAYYALGLFYRNLATNQAGKVTNPAMEQKAVQAMHFILQRLNSNDPDVKKALASWGEN